MTRREQAQRAAAYAQSLSAHAKSWEAIECTVCHRTLPSLPETTWMSGERDEPVCSACLKEWNLRSINAARERAKLDPFPTLEALQAATKPHLTESP